MAKQNRNIIFKTIAIDDETNRLVEKICKRVEKGRNSKTRFSLSGKGAYQSRRCSRIR